MRDYVASSYSLSAAVLLAANWNIAKEIILLAHRDRHLFLVIQGFAAERHHKSLEFEKHSS
jgi:hypothetical protein